MLNPGPVCVWDTCGISHYCYRVMAINDEAKIALHSGSTLERRRHFGYSYSASSSASVGEIWLKN